MAEPITITTEKEISIKRTITIEPIGETNFCTYTDTKTVTSDGETKTTTTHGASTYDIIKSIKGG